MKVNKTHDDYSYAVPSLATSHLCKQDQIIYKSVHSYLCRCLPACRRLLFPLLHAEKGRLRNAVANRVPASCWVPKILGTRCDRLTHSAHCLT